MKRPAPSAASRAMRTSGSFLTWTTVSSSPPTSASSAATIVRSVSLSPFCHATAIHSRCTVAAPAASASRAAGATASATAAAEWATWFTQFLTQATGQSAKTLELYQQVLAAISRGELAPTALQDLLPGFLQVRGATYANTLTELTTKFYAGLVEIGAAHSRELAELVVPGGHVPDVPPPVFESADPMQWFQRLVEYAGQLNARAMKAYQAHLNRVAAGETTPDQLQRAMSEYLERRLPDHLRQSGQLYFQLLTDLNEMRARYEEEYLNGVL